MSRLVAAIGLCCVLQINVLVDSIDIDFSGGNVETESSITCPAGTIAHDSSGYCLMCAEGTYESENTECLDCDIGYYNDDEGATNCQSCPANLSTIGVGSTSDQCIEICEVPDVDFSDGSSPVSGTRVTPDTSVIMSCIDGYQVDNRDHLATTCRDVATSCTNITLWGKESVHVGASVTLTCEVVTTVTPTEACNWYSGQLVSTWLGESRMLKIKDNSYEAEFVMNEIEEETTVSCKTQLQGFVEQNNNDFRIKVNEAPPDPTDSPTEEEGITTEDNKIEDETDEAETTAGENVQRMAVYIVIGVAGLLVLLGIALPITYMFFDRDNKKERRKNSYQ